MYVGHSLEMKNLSRRGFLKTTVAGGSVLASGAINAERNSPAVKRDTPNLVIVFPDQMRGSAMGFLGGEPVITPNLDRFAAQSLVLTQAVSNWPVCSPYRAMLMTGMYPHANKVVSNCTSKTAPYNCELQESDRCWSDVLKDNGYSLGYIGKWHLDSPRKPYIDCRNNRGDVKWNEWCPPHRRHGFDFWHSYGTYDWHLEPMYWDTDATRDGFRYVDQWGPEHEADLAVKYIRNEDGQYREADQPFALVVSMNPPHMPYQYVPQKYVDRYEGRSLDDLLHGRPNIRPQGTKWGDYTRKHMRNYYAMITGVDEQFGRILKALKQTGVEENTIVLFTADHGDCLGMHDEITKTNPYEEALIVPFLLRWPGRIEPRKDKLLLSVPDIYPTLLDLMGLADDIPDTVQGVSHASLFVSGKGKRPTSALYMKIPHSRPSWGQRGVRTDGYTLIIDRATNRPAKTILFDNTADPFQLKNVAAEHPDLVSKLTREELLPALKRVGDPWRPE